MSRINNIFKTFDENYSKEAEAAADKMVSNVASRKKGMMSNQDKDNLRKKFAANIDKMKSKKKQEADTPAKTRYKDNDKDNRPDGDEDDKIQQKKAKNRYKKTRKDDDDSDQPHKFSFGGAIL